MRAPLPGEPAGNAHTDRATHTAVAAADLEDRLKRHFGFASFRPHQREIVEAELSGRDVFAALPTGGGKSLCYQLPALLRPGLTVVVSPLISLMKDQVDGARENGLPAAFLNSSLDPDQARATWQEVATGNLRLLYVSPERLALPNFRAAIGRVGMSLLAVDEAHCISEWGHEFRPEYRTLGLLRSEFPEVPIAAFTATATRQVQSDVISLLELREPFVVRASFDRPEIFYRVLPKLDVERQIFSFVTARADQPGIVYRSTRKAAETTADRLARRGIAAVAYHAGLDDETRRRRQEAFVRDEVSVVVATIAFGMGIDKSNVRWIVHADLPRSLEGYYQETGRSARDGEPADTVLFYGPGDIAAIRWHIERTRSPQERDRAELRLREVLRYVESATCRRRQLLAHFDEPYHAPCERCDVCTGEVRLEDATEAARMVLSAAVRTGERFGAHHLADVVVGNPTDKVMERGHHQLPTFGVGREQSRAYWLSMIQQLAAAGHLARGEGRTAGFRLTDQGRLLLRGKEQFLAREHGGGAPAGSTDGIGAGRTGRAAAGASPSGSVPGAGPAAPGGSAPPAAEQEALLKRLKELRKRIAFRRNVPPYVVFSDKSLRVMAASRPTDRAALLRCHGVGDRKLAAYGDEFINTIREFLAEGEREGR